MKTHFNVLSKDTAVATDNLAAPREFKLKKGSQKMIFSMFTKGLYSNPIGSIVREITSNCFDAHTEAGVDDAVRIKFTEENNQSYLNFIDVGVGMSEDRFYNIYAEYFNSTKDNDDDFIGGFGIGGKTPLAYSESFFVISNYNGTRNIWCIYKGELAPMVVPMLTEQTTERNGTTIKIPIKAVDYNKFERELTRQLYYFENVVFEGFSDSVENEYTIYRAKNFIYRGDEYSSRMHICFGRVAYPIDYSALELIESDYNVPIALKFNIGELEVTPNREAIQYSPETIVAIKKKLEAAKAEIREMLLQQYKNISSLEEYYRIKAAYGNLILDASKNVVITLDKSMAKPEELVYSKYDHIRLPDVESLTKLFVKIDTVGRKKATKKEDEEKIWNGSFLTAASFNDVYFIESGEKKNKRTQSWLKSIHPIRYFFVSTHKHLNDKNFEMYERASLTDEGYVEIVKSMHKDAHSQLIDIRTKLLPLGAKLSQEFFTQVRVLMDDVLTMMRSNSTAYNTIAVPDEFVILRKNEFSKAMLDRKVHAVNVRGGYGNKRKETTFRQLIDYKGIIIYGSTGEDYLVKAAYDALYHLGMVKRNDKYSLFNSESSVHAVLFNKTTVELLKHVKNAVHHTQVYSRFVMKKREVIHKIIQSRVFMIRYSNINDLFFNKALTSVDKKLKLHGDKLTQASKGFKEFSERSTHIFDLKKLKIDESKFKSGFDKHFEYIEEQAKKNEMIKYVNIPRWDDATKNKELMKLIDLVYVK